MKERRISRRTRGSPDRVVLVEAYLPVFARRGGRILWVGCRRYTDDYPAMLEARGGECWTTDIDPEAARFGHRRRHRTADLVSIDQAFGDLRFGAILCNGVFGYGVDGACSQAAAAQAMAAIAEPGALLLLGWNTDKTGDPGGAGVFTGLFQPVSALGLPSRRDIPGTTHVYDLLARTPGPR
jgi:hypothetical protein